MIRAPQTQALHLHLIAWMGMVACSEPGRPELVVFAAASTTDLVLALEEGFEAAELRTSFGPSSGLARQIRDGAPADVFLSAHGRWIDLLRESDQVHAERVIAGNGLVCIATPSRFDPLPTTPAELAARCRPADRIAVADRGVPAGEYARASLAATGDLSALEPFFVGQQDVRAVLRSVASGQAVAGFVYRTDARLADVDLLFALPDETHAPVEVRAVSLVETELAAEFLAYLGSEPARRILAEAGFSLPEGP